MLGKDYTLSIILLNYEDDVWPEQTNPDLPSGWRIVSDSTGTYYWHVPSGATQWQHPCHSMETSGSNHFEGKDRSSLQHDDGSNDTDSKCFSVSSLGWVEVPEEDLRPGRSSLSISNIIQTLSDRQAEKRDRQGAWREEQHMMMVLKNETLNLLDPSDHTLIHSQPIINIRVWGVGCNNGRDFAFVAGDKDSCMLKCHVFRCDVPAKTISMAMHSMCSKAVKPSRSLTMENIWPEHLPSEDVRVQSITSFDLQYIGNLPVSTAMGIKVLNRAIESILDSADREDWQPISMQVSDSVLSLRKRGKERPFWESQVRFLTFLGIGHDTHTFAVIVDRGTRRFDCLAFWCEPSACLVSETLQAACMVQYQRCLVSQTPPVRARWHGNPSTVKRANSMDSSAFHPPPCYHDNSVTTNTTRVAKSNVSANNSMKKGMMAFFETFRNKQQTSNI